MTAAERATSPAPPPQLLLESHPGKLLHQHYAVVGSIDLKSPLIVLKKGFGKRLRVPVPRFPAAVVTQETGSFGGGGRLTPSLDQYDP